MTRRIIAVAALCLVSSVASTQQPPVKATEKKMEAMDHSKMEMGTDKHEGMSPWKELDGYHMLMMATWHPAKDMNDLKPIRAKSVELVASAKTLAASNAPKGCDSPALKAAAKALPGESQKVADLVAKNADDAALKTALSALHDTFDVLEEGCKKPEMKH